jgi:hypothetical protein
MLRSRVIPMFFVLGAATLAGCGRSPTAPRSEPPTAVQPASPATGVSASASQPERTRATVSSERGRSKYSVILF